ncbi:MAG: hypothetical protein GXO27_01830, partial [Chlorobi bacterium]|nr:hypothetical protein [Chlorobiota bacterium]
GEALRILQSRIYPFKREGHAYLQLLEAAPAMPWRYRLTVRSGDKSAAFVYEVHPRALDPDRMEILPGDGIVRVRIPVRDDRKAVQVTRNGRPKSPQSFLEFVFPAMEPALRAADALRLAAGTR